VQIEVRVFTVIAIFDVILTTMATLVTKGTDFLVLKVNGERVVTVCEVFVKCLLRKRGIDST
jgi:hypothetical protein